MDQGTKQAMGGRQFVVDTLMARGERSDSLYLTIEDDSDGPYVKSAIDEENGEMATFFVWKPALQELIDWLATQGMIAQRPSTS